MNAYVSGPDTFHANNTERLHKTSIVLLLTALFRGLSNIAQENTTADFSVEDQQHPGYCYATLDQEQELHKLNC